MVNVRCFEATIRVHQVYQADSVCVSGRGSVAKVAQHSSQFRERQIANEVKWQEKPWSTTPLWLLTHTETHEFHHKGQIVAMARHLGYNPPDTDLQEPVL